MHAGIENKSYRDIAIETVADAAAACGPRILGTAKWAIKMKRQREQYFTAVYEMRLLYS